MTFKMQADAQATILVNSLRFPAATEKLVLTLKRALSPDEALLSPPEVPGRPPLLPEGKVSRPQHVSVQCQTEQATRLLGEPKPSAAEREGGTRPLKSHLRLNIIRAALIATWCCSNIALLLSNRQVFGLQPCRPCGTS